MMVVRLMVRLMVVVVVVMMVRMVVMMMVVVVDSTWEVENKEVACRGGAKMFQSHGKNLKPMWFA